MKDAYTRPMPAVGFGFNGALTAAPFVIFFYPTCILVDILVERVPDFLRLLLGCLLLLPLVAVAGLLSKTYLSSEGLRGYDGFGSYSFVPWNSVEYLGQMNLFGMRYFRIKSPNKGRAIVIPVHTFNKREFVTIVAQHLGEEHPFTLALREEWNLPRT